MQADNIYYPFGYLMNRKRNTYDMVKAEFKNHFIKPPNPIYKRTKFNQRKQLPGESVDDFITALIEYCEYGELRNKMISDHTVA